MNSKRIVALALFLVVVLLSIGYIWATRDVPPVGSAPTYEILSPEEVPEETVTFYDAADVEAVAVFKYGEVTVTHTSLGTITLREIDSPTGGLYANENESIVVWDKGDKLTILEGDTMLFEGYGEEPEPEEAPSLTGTWKWVKSDGQYGDVSGSLRPDSFTVTFNEDGSMSGTTDCNGFGGTFTLGKYGVLSFGPLMATQMYCEDSREQVFTDALSEVGTYTVSEDGILSLFLKNEAGAIHLKVQE